MGKKADFALLERLRESSNKKVDFEQFQSQLGKLKQELETLVEQTQLTNPHKSLDQDEKLAKAVANSERALDELYYFRETMKTMQEERKKDVEDTADFINQLINNSKNEQQREHRRVLGELEVIRREIADKAPTLELLETKSNFIGQLEAKVDLKEVQGALNECQNDIVAQLEEFKNSIHKDLRQSQDDIFRMMDCKANAMDVQEQLDTKADTLEAKAQFADKARFEQAL